MYTLRTVSKRGSFNQYLGRVYNSVNRFEHRERFLDDYKKVFPNEHIADLDPTSDDNSKNVIGFIETSDGVLIPIYQYDSNYIMMNGETVEHVNRAMTRMS